MRLCGYAIKFIGNNTGTCHCLTVVYMYKVIEYVLMTSH